METMWKLVRNKVSGDKTRYTNGNYDLDLTYITDRIIGNKSTKRNEIKTFFFLAMSFPADGMESTYRNSINGLFFLFFFFYSLFSYFLISMKRLHNC